MTASRPSLRLALGTSIALAVSLSIPAVAEEEEGSLGHDPSSVIGLLDAQPADLLSGSVHLRRG